MNGILYAADELPCESLHHFGPLPLLRRRAPAGLLALDLFLDREVYRVGKRCTFEGSEFSYHRVRFLVFDVQAHAVYLFYHSVLPFYISSIRAPLRPMP